jgi:hypothetical protein
MSEPIYPAAETVGSRWMTCDSTTAQYPTDGVGGATTTAGSSTVANATMCVIDRVIPSVFDATSNLLLLTGAGATIDTFNAADATQVGRAIELGIQVDSAFGFKLSGGSGVYQVMYRVIRR